MDLKPKTEPGSPPVFASSDVGGDKTLMNMTIPDLISVLRIAIRKKQFDQVESVLVAREAQLKREVEKMREILDCDRLDRMKIEEDLKKCGEECEKGKRAEELYEKLLGVVKKNGPLDEEDATIDQLRTKNCRLEDELESWKRKFVGLNERLSRLEFDTRLLMTGGNTEKEEDYGAELGVPFEVEVEKENNGIYVHGHESGNNNADSTRSRRNEDTNPNKDGLGASASGRLGLGTIIEIEDSDDDNGDCVSTSQGSLDKKKVTSQIVTNNGHPISSEAAQQKNIPSTAEDVIGMLKRKFGEC